MRFRRLTQEEFEQLEQDFVHFLASNQITAKEWETMKTNDADKVHELLDIFSDIVLEKVFNKMEYLQHRSKDIIRVFHCQEDKITMTGLKIEDADIDLSNPEHLALLAKPEGIKGSVKVFQMEKEYAKERADEIFDMIYKSNCQVAPQAMFQMLVDMYQQTIK